MRRTATAGRRVRPAAELVMADRPVEGDAEPGGGGGHLPAAAAGDDEAVGSGSRGVREPRGTEGVGRSTTTSVVVVSIAILIADALLTQIFLSL